MAKWTAADIPDQTGHVAPEPTPTFSEFVSEMTFRRQVNWENDIGSENPRESSASQPCCRGIGERGEGPAAAGVKAHEAGT